MTRLASQRRWIIYIQRICFGLIIGAGFGLGGGLVLHPPLLGAAMGAISIATTTAASIAFTSGAGIFLPRTRFGQAFTRTLAQAPFLVAVAVKGAFYMAVFVAVLGSRLGTHAALLAFNTPAARELAAQAEIAMPLGFQIAVTAMTAFLLVLLRQAALLIGEHTMRDIVFGRYRRPRMEERFFLFVDIIGSTPIAERLGPLAMHRYLSQIFALASDPIDDHGGDVVFYVGDEIVITWTVPRGRREARPLACFFAIEDALVRATPGFEREFGTVPKLRAALHAGEVVTGETGGSRRAIVFNGDVMNATSRLEGATRGLGRPFLVSEDALRRLDDPAGFVLEDLGPQQLRGKQVAMRVFAVKSLPVK